MIRIGKFSELAKTTIKTLRFYDEIGLFKPVFVDNNGYRYYSIEQLNLLQKIIELRKLDIPIDEIKCVINGMEITKVFEKRLQELENELKMNQLNISLIKDYMAKAKKGVFMNKYKAEVITLPECVVYYRHGIIDSMKDLVPFILEAGDEVKKNNPSLKCSKLDYCFVTYTAEEYKEKDVEVEYVEAVEKIGKESENIKFKTLSSQKAISVMHKGSYVDLGKVYAYAVNYVKEKGFEISAPIRERYIHGCWDCENEDNYLTEIQIPIE